MKERDPTEGGARRKVRAAALSVASNVALVATKLVVAAATGSVSVLSEAVHSAIDLAAALIAFFSVRFASRPADEGHPHGHGKIENLSGSIEAALIFVAAALIAVEAVDRLRHPGRLAMPWMGVAVMGLSAAVNLAVATHLRSVARQTDSAALDADAAHLRTDVYTSLGGMAALAAVATTGFQPLDAVIALAVAVVIAWEGWVVVRRSARDLLDASLPESETAVIRRVLDRHTDRIRNWHALRTRKSGSERKVDLHLTLCRGESVGESHALCDEIEREIGEGLPGVETMIHVESCARSEEECLGGTCDPASHVREAVGEIAGRWTARSVVLKDFHVHRGGAEAQIDLSLALPPGATVAEAHEACDAIEREIRGALPRCRAMVHVEPAAMGEEVSTGRAARGDRAREVGR